MLYRRFCAAALAAICIISAINGADAQCQVRPRREIRRLSRRDREAYFSAIRQLQSTGSPSLYDDYTRRHLDAHEAAHGTAQFLPWHRWFIHDFEVALQRINSNIMIPYWDWSIDSQQPAASPIFRSDWYGGNGNPQADYCVQDGKFADYRPAYPEPHCLRRRFDNGRRLSAFYSPPQIDSVLQATTYSEFKRQLEGPPHALVHINIGSNLADISTMYSPNDPIFWLHHAFIDKIWADWQGLHSQNALAYEGGSPSDIGNINLSNQLFQSSLTVADVMDTRQLCYYYESSRGANTQGETRTSRLRRDLSAVTNSTTNSTSYVHTSTNKTATTYATTPAETSKNKTATTYVTTPVETNKNKTATTYATTPAETSKNKTATTSLTSYVETNKTATPVKTNTNKTTTKNSTTTAPVPAYAPASAPSPSNNHCNTYKQDNDTVPSNAPYVGDKVEVLALQHTLPIPKSWIVMNSLNETSVRIHEKQHYELVESLNADPSYISSAAPFLNGDMFKYIVESAGTITCTLGGRSLTIEISKHVANMIAYIRSLIDRILEFITDIRQHSFKDVKDKAVETFKNLLPKN